MEESANKHLRSSTVNVKIPGKFISKADLPIPDMNSLLFGKKKKILQKAM